MTAQQPQHGAIQQQVASLLRRQRIQPFVTDLKPQSFKMILTQRILCFAGNGQERKMDLPSLGILKHTRQAVVRLGPGLRLLPGELALETPQNVRWR